MKSKPQGAEKASRTRKSSDPESPTSRANGRGGLEIPRRFSRAGSDPYASVTWRQSDSRITNPDGSVVDLVVNLKERATVEGVNAAFREAAEGPLAGILEYTEDPIVSSDIIGNPHSTVFDAGSTMVMEGDMVKVVAWYDNEWGYSNRVVDLMKYAHGLVPAGRKAARA